MIHEPKTEGSRVNIPTWFRPARFAVCLAGSPLRLSRPRPLICLRTQVQLTMPAAPKIPWDKLKADTLRAICRDFGANPGKRKREGMLEFLRAVETTGRASRPLPAHPPAALC